MAVQKSPCTHFTKICDSYTYIVLLPNLYAAFYPVQATQLKPLMSTFHRGSLARSYDLRKVWGKYISPPIDQGWCGASWAISTVQVASDRYSIMSKGLISDLLSPQHLLSCNNHNQQGCDGGHLTRAWTWIRKFGWVNRLFSAIQSAKCCDGKNPAFAGAEKYGFHSQSGF